ncbi:MAG: FAD-dependent oxidoreductase [Alphaproteobacteria bacterium]|nr:FAD-dependent oxidoreductase [Alphaproteobacteria bacterium]
MEPVYDVVVVGAGTAGLPTAIFAAQRGARVLMLEAADDIGGTLHVTGGQMSAAGTRAQAAKGIVDSPDRHFDDVMRISRDNANARMVRLAVDNAAETMHWLFDLGYQLDPATPTIFLGHEPYRIARTYYAHDKGREVIRVIRPVVERLVREGKITLLLRHEMTGFAVGTSSGIDAVIANARPFVGRNYVLTTGGYAANRDLFPKLPQVTRCSAVPTPTRWGPASNSPVASAPSFAAASTSSRASPRSSTPKNRDATTCSPTRRRNRGCRGRSTSRPTVAASWPRICPRSTIENTRSCSARI